VEFRVFTCHDHWLEDSQNSTLLRSLKAIQATPECWHFGAMMRGEFFHQLDLLSGLPRASSQDQLSRNDWWY
jgi:hypothetical protein